MGECRLVRGVRSSASPIGHGSGNVADLGCSAEYLAAVELLADVQDQAGVPFPLPNEFTREEVLELERAKRLLAGEEIRGTWTQSSGQLKRKHAQLLTNDLAQIGDAFILFNRRPMWLESESGGSRWAGSCTSRIQQG